MKRIIKVEKEVDIKFLHVSAGVRYWEDTEVNGIEDETGELIPCRNGEYWEPIIDVDTGIIINWPKGIKANVHYKCCDDGTYTLLDSDKSQIIAKEGYVPDCLCPEEAGYGDYIIMSIDENGHIDGWVAEFDDFFYED
jgi:hypothetical protein